MNRTQFEKHLRAHGCWRYVHGGRHDIWLSPTAAIPVAVPRHKEIKLGTARAICKQLGIPAPSGR
ncbi:MAG: type II toxin-antitoxin system HicA family toxin [Planctomycetaceae bacterium]|nr:type II toxin-antitoxin system HicA family toxin [Planctomycetaceae bacterium]